MLTFNKAQNQGELKRYVEGSCLSSDTKPVTNIANGSTLLEIDTSKVYMFDEQNSEWKAWS